jgi:hypothetical protein
MPDENSETGTLSLDQAADMLMEPEGQPDADEAQIETDDTEEVETEAAADEDEGQADDVDADDVDEVSEEDDDPIVSVRVDGKDVDVPLSEALKGYSREAHFTQKMTELSQDRKSLEAERASEMEAIQSQKAQLENALAHFAVPTDQEPNWADLAARTEPREYNRIRAEWEQRTAQSAQAQQYYQAIKQQDRQTLMQTEQAKLIEAFPEWREPAVFQAAANEMVSSLSEYGFSPEETGQIMDHRMFKVAQDAIKYRKLQAQKPAVNKKVVQAAKQLKPGARQAKNQQSEQHRKKMDRLRKSGSLDDAVNAILME